MKYSLTWEKKFQFKVKKVTDSDGKTIPSLVKSEGMSLLSLFTMEGIVWPSLSVNVFNLKKKKKNQVREYFNI